LRLSEEADEAESRPDRALQNCDGDLGENRMSDHPAAIADPDRLAQSGRRGTGPLDGGTGSIDAEDIGDEIGFDRVNPADASTPENSSDKGRDNISDRLVDGVVSALPFGDPQSFLGGLVGALSRPPSAVVRQNSSIEIARRVLAHGIAQDLDEQTVLENLVAALASRNFRPELLYGAAPIIAGFLARIASEPIRAAPSEPAAPENLAALFQSARQVVLDMLAAHGSRGWRILPNIAAVVADRVVEQGLSIGDLAAALPRLSGRVGSNPENGLASATDRPGVRMKPRRIVLTGPVEIVILER
jgi:hypothetical protein